MQDGRAWIFDLVDAVAEAHHLFLASEPVLGPSADRLRRAVLDAVQGGKHLLVGASVERPGKAAYRRCHDRIRVGERGSRHAGRECRRVHRVLGMEDQSDVENPFGKPGWDLPLQHVEEVRGMAELGARLDGVISAPNPIPGRDDGRQLRDQADHAQTKEFGVGDVVALVEHAHRGDGGGQRIHRFAALRQRLQEVDDAELEPALGDQLLPELVELGAGRKAPKEQHIRDLFVGPTFGEHLDRVPSVLKLPDGSIDQTDAATGRWNAGQAWNVFAHFRHRLHFRAKRSGGNLAVHPTGASRSEKLCKYRTCRAENQVCTFLEHLLP